MVRRTRGGNAKLKHWASKAMSLVKKYGPGITRKYKLGSRGLSYASKSLPAYAKYIDPVQKFVAQSGYGRRGGGVSNAGGSLRAVGGRKCTNHCRRRR
jgi:hypothetical protein